MTKATKSVNASLLNRLDYGALRSFQTDPARFLTILINKYLKSAPTNWSVPFQHPFYAEPVAIAFGDGDSPAFQNIKNKYPWSLTPRECLERPPAVQVSTVNGNPKSNVEMPGRPFAPVITKNGKKSWPKGEPPLPPWKASTAGNSYEDKSYKKPSFKPIEYVTCISIGLPIHPDTLKAEASYPWGNSPDLKIHSLWGSHLGFVADLSFYVVNILQMFGYLAIAPSFTTWGQEFMMDFQYEGVTSRDTVSPCPEREWAVAAGLGTYGLPDMIISERGMAIILTAVMTSAQIQPSPKPNKEYCLYYRNGSCRKCIERCPGEAISITTNPPGRLAAKCVAGGVAQVDYNLTYLKDRMIRELGDYADMSGNIVWGGSGLRKPILGFPACGRCYTDVPCSTSIPE
jgi:hypothetical protein